MSAFNVIGDAFSDYFLTRLIWEEPSLREYTGQTSAQESFKHAFRTVREAQKALRDRRQVKSTESLLLEPLAEIFGWNLEERVKIDTDVGAEDAGRALIGPNGPIARIVAISPDASMDAAPDGFHRRFAPSLSLVRVLEETGLNWGILINAYRMRIVRRTEGFLSSSIEFDLSAIADAGSDGLDAWKVAWALLQNGSWQTAPCVLDRVVTLGRDHMQKVNENLGMQVQNAIVSFCQGVMDNPRNHDRLNAIPRDELLPILYSQTLKVLYRLLFILYAESRSLLPMDLPTYRDGYSLTRLSRRATNPETDPRQGGKHVKCFFESTVRALFNLLRQGVDLGPEGRIPAYGGALFDVSPDNPGSTHFIESLTWGDAVVAEVLDYLTRVEGKRGAGKQPVSYRELDVEHLGSIYEGLLEQTIAITDTELWRVKLDGKELLVKAEQRADLASRRGEQVIGEARIIDSEPADEPEDDFEPTDDEESEEDEESTESKAPKKPIRTDAKPIPKGTAYLKAAVGRKQSGSYYTSRALVDFLVRRAIDPLVKNKTPQEILSLKIADPAMGSGHFLVGATRRLGEHLLAAYRDEVSNIMSQIQNLTENEVLCDADIPSDLQRVWKDDIRALAVCRLLVAGNCIYGVDKNPLAVDLAKVSLWLTTAAADHPLTFLDHRLQCGDSLLGLDTDMLLQAPEVKQKTGKSKGKKDSSSDSPTIQLDMLESMFDIAGEKLRQKLARAMMHLKTIRRLVDENPLDFVNQRLAYSAMQGELSEFITLHDMRIGTALTPGASVVPIDTALSDLGKLERISDDTLISGSDAVEKGGKAKAFCWQLMFPDVWFDEKGIRRKDAGFSTIIGNPPWDKMKPNEREFYSEIDPTVWDYQGTARKRFISGLLVKTPHLQERWDEHVQTIAAQSKFLLNETIYTHQTAIADGKKTGGDPDCFKFFLERAFHLLQYKGRAGLIVPSGIQSSQGCTALRKMLLDDCSLESICKLDNERTIFPGVHHNQKFDLVVFSKGGSTLKFTAAFYRWEPAEVLLSFDTDPRSVTVDIALIHSLDLEQYPIVEVRNPTELDTVWRIYKQFPKLGKKVERTWNIGFNGGLHMTNDAHLFREGARLAEMGAKMILGRKWETSEDHYYTSSPNMFVHAVRDIDSKGRIHFSGDLDSKKIAFTHSGYIFKTEEHQLEVLPVIPAATYVPLYEGRLVHQFDHTAKAYVSGSGARSKWRELEFPEKEILPHYFMAESHFSSFAYRAGFCDVTGQTNERSALAAIIPQYLPCGNTVSMATTNDTGLAMLWISILNSFTVDWLLRLRVSNHLNFFLVNKLPMPRPSLDSPSAHTIVMSATRLTCFTSEMADLWNELAIDYPEELSFPWTMDKATTDLHERAKLRARIDALVAELYGISLAEYALILSTFPLLDRDQPPLEGDVFIRMTKSGEKVTPRSFITRDKALLAYFELKGETPPDDIVKFFSNAGVDISRQTGPIRDLRERVFFAEEVLGAVAYVPTKAGAGK